MLLRFSISTILLTVTTIQTSSQTEDNNKIIRANTYQSFNNGGTSNSGIVVNEKVQSKVKVKQIQELCKEVVIVKAQQPMLGGDDYHCEVKEIGKEDKNGQVPSNCENGPGWRGNLTKFENIENAINWTMLVQRPECVSRIILRTGQGFRRFTKKRLSNKS